MSHFAGNPAAIGCCGSSVVRGSDRRIAQPLFRIVKPCGLYGKPGLFLQMRSNGCTEEKLALGLLLLRLLLVPNKNADVLGRNTAGHSEQENEESFHRP